MDIQQVPNQNPNLNPTPIPVGKMEKLKQFVRENKLSVWLIGLSALIIAALAFFIFYSPKAPTAPKVTVEIDAPSEVPSGSDLMYKINISNRDTAAIKNVSLDLIYPQGFSFKDSTPKAENSVGNLFDIPNLDPSQDVTVMIRGSVLGNATEVKNIKAVLHYTFADFNSKFVSQSDANTTILTSNVNLHFAGQQSMNNQQDTKYVLTYNNTTPDTLSNLKLVLTIPDAFKVSEYDIKPDIGTTYNITNLLPNSPKSIEIKGRFQNAPIDSEQIFAAKVQGQDMEGKPLTLSSIDYTVKIGAIPLTADLTLINGATSEATDPGQALQYQVSYRNNSSVPLSGVMIVARLKGEGIDLSTVQAENADVNDYTITWDGSRVPALGVLQPGDSGTLSFGFQVKKPVTKSASKNMTVAAKTEIQSKESEQVYGSQDVITKVNTVVSLTKNVAYSSGQNPPQVGQSTRYTVNVGINNATNDLSNGTVSMTLPNAVSFDKATINPEEQPNVTFDASTKKLTWKLNSVSAHSGSFTALRKLQFSVVVVPSTSLQGRTVPLVTNLVFNATDSFTSKAISLGPDSLSTSDDPSGLGVVQ